MSIRVFLAGLFLLIPSLAIAADEVAPTCDITVQNQMKQQAFLEGQREMEIAQRLILKSDSVLEYSCFKEEADNWGAKAGIFSDKGGGTAPGSQPNLGNAINGLVISALTEYLKNNYGHLFLGGTYVVEYICQKYTSVAQCQAAETEENKPYCNQCPAFLKSDACNPQQQIWTLAKCANVAVEPTKEPAFFFPLSKLLDKDIRDLPETCPEPEKTARDDLVQTVQQKQDEFPDATKTPPYGVDNVSHVTGTAGGETYKTLLTECGQPVKTGFKVKPLEGKGEVSDDAVCIAPGCTYANGSCQ
jgi:hypothetical protein